MGFRVQGVGFRVYNSMCRGSGGKNHSMRRADSDSRSWDAGCSASSVEGLGCKVQGVGVTLNPKARV